MNELFNFGQPRNLVTTYAPTIGMPSTIEQDVLPMLLVKYEKETGLFPEKISVLILNNKGICRSENVLSNFYPFKLTICEVN